jgi:hypothetical protein
MLAGNLDTTGRRVEARVNEETKEAKIVFNEVRASGETKKAKVVSNEVRVNGETKDQGSVQRGESERTERPRRPK